MPLSGAGNRSVRRTESPRNRKPPLQASAIVVMAPLPGQLLRIRRDLRDMCRRSSLVKTVAAPGPTMCGWMRHDEPDYEALLHPNYAEAVGFGRDHKLSIRH
jgi:hypothetical protein